MTYYAFFHGYIVTANADGSIPINSKTVCMAVPANEAEQSALHALIAQANAIAKAEGR